MTETVVIAGAGTTGLMLAYELRLAGVPAVVADPLPGPNPAAFGVAINPGYSEILDQRGLLDPIRDTAFVLPGAHYSLLWLDLDRQGEPHGDGYAVSQTRLEEMLEARAVALGAVVRRGWRVGGFTQDADGVTVELVGKSGREEVRAAYLVGCDGSRSTVRSLLGIDFPGTQDPRCLALIGDLEVDMNELTPEHFGAYVPDGGGSIYTGVPVGPGVLRVLTMQWDKDAPGLDEPATEDEFQAAIEQISGSPLKDTQSLWLSRFSDATRQADRFRRGRVFLAGDAAHVFFQTNGLGLSTAIQDVANLGWKLAADLHGWAPDGLLDTYEAERFPVAEQVCRDVRAQEELVRGPQLGPLRDAITELLRFDDVQQYLIALVTGVGVRYPLGKDADGGHPLLGRRLPQVTLSTPDGKRTAASLLHRGLGVLLDMSGGAADVAAAADWAGRVEVVDAEPHPQLDASAVLLRPDGHAAWIRAAQPDAEGLRSALSAWFGEPTSTRDGGEDA